METLVAPVEGSAQVCAFLADWKKRVQQANGPSICVCLHSHQTYQGLLTSIEDTYIVVRDGGRVEIKRSDIRSICLK